VKVAYLSAYIWISESWSIDLFVEVIWFDLIFSWGYLINEYESSDSSEPSGEYSLRWMQLEVKAPGTNDTIEYMYVNKNWVPLDTINFGPEVLSRTSIESGNQLFELHLFACGHASGDPSTGGVLQFSALFWWLIMLQ